MEGGGWGTVIQALILAFCTWYMRQGSKKDSDKVSASTASPGDVKQVERKVESLRAEFDILKTAYFKQNPVKIDHRGPTKGDDNA